MSKESITNKMNDMLDDIDRGLKHIKEIQLRLEVLEGSTFNLSSKQMAEELGVLTNMCAKYVEKNK